MRILVADQNALLLAAITATFGKHCDLVTATRRDVCIAYVEQQKFDVVVACDKMADYTGLELLSEVAALSPGTLLIFAASTERLQRLSYRLQVFGLLDTLAYPITPRKLLNALRRAREHLPSRAARKIRHVVLESEWDTGERLALVEKDLDAAIARHSSGIGEADWENGPMATGSAQTRRTRGDGADAGSLGVGGVEEFVFAPSPDDESDPVATERVAQLPATQDCYWEVSEYQGFVYESAEDTVIEVMPADVPIAHGEDPLAQVDYDAVGNDPAFDVPEPESWTEDGAANDSEFRTESTTPGGGREEGSGQTLSATLSSTGAWSVGPNLLPALENSQEGGGASSSSVEPAPQLSPASSTATAPESASIAAAATADPKAAAKRQSQPRPRAQSAPTDAQRAAFDRALARRNAERAGGKAGSSGDASRRGHKKRSAAENRSASAAKPASSMVAGPGSGESKSLTDLARMATKKRPLTITAAGKTVPKRAVFAVGSGLAAVILLGVLSFELVRPDHSAVAQQRPTQLASSQLFSPATAVLPSQGGSGAAQLVPPPASPGVPQGTAPVAQNFDPNTAPSDPPPPPAVEQPGPMEPPPRPVEEPPPPPWAGPPPTGPLPGGDESSEQAWNQPWKQQ